MFGGMCYGFLLTSAAAGVLFGVYYAYDSQGAQRLAYRATFAGVRTYVRCKRFVEGLKRSELSRDLEEDKECRDLLLHYQGKQRVSYCMDDSGSVHAIDIDPANDLLVLKRIGPDNETQYKRIHPLTAVKSVGDVQVDDVEMITIPKQFLQIELQYTDDEKKVQTIDIHHNLRTFYVKGNKLLDALFLQWYLDYWYNMRLPDKYSLQIFDKDVNRFTIDNDEYVILEGEGYIRYKNSETQPERHKDK